MKKLFRLVLVSSLSLMCFSCYYDEIIEEEEIPEVPEGTIVSFKNDIEPIFREEANNCTACHNGGVQKPDLREGKAYNSIVPEYVIKGDGENSEFYIRLPGNDHSVPVGFELNAEKRGLIKTWIDRGAENN